MNMIMHGGGGWVGGWGDQAGGGLDRETVKTTCTFFRNCTWLVGVVSGGGGG